MAIKSNGKPQIEEVPGSRLYDVLKGIDFEKRELIGKPHGVGLFDLVKERSTGKLRCYACTLCERVCPTDCIEIDYCPEFEELPFDVKADRAAASQPEIGMDMALFDTVIARLREGAGMIEAFHATQEAYGWLPRRALEEIAGEMQVPFSRVFGVASFYSQFRLQPVGKYVVNVCMGTACHVAGAPLVAEALAQELEIGVGETTADGLFTLQTVNCVGACALAPVVRVGDDDTHGRVGPNEARRLVRKLRKAEVA